MQREVCLQGLSNLQLALLTHVLALFNQPADKE
jgi:hypothetical protein